MSLVTDTVLSLVAEDCSLTNWGELPDGNPRFHLLTTAEMREELIEIVPSVELLPAAWWVVDLGPDGKGNTIFREDTAAEGWARMRQVCGSDSV